MPAVRTVIAIDGPAASGKSSVARELAARLRYVYVNTGAMYRAVTWHALQRGVASTDVPGVTALLDADPLACRVHDGQTDLTLAGEDPTPHLSCDEVNRTVSQVSAVPAVRERLTALQRSLAQAHDVVMEGRDIGTTVFPQTAYKFFVDASPEVRMRRRELQGLNDPLGVRDRLDSTRATAPLTVAADAEVIDSSDLSVAEVVEVVLRALARKGLRAPAPAVD